MGMRNTPWVLGLGAAFVIAACAPIVKSSGTDGQSYAGWYMEHEGQSTFQPCGQSQRWKVSESAKLRSKARDFGLEADTPVYTRLFGSYSESGKALKVSRVEQFGSQTPMRICGMTGLVLPAKSSADD